MRNYLGNLSTFGNQDAAPHVVFDMFGIMTETPDDLKENTSLVLAGPGFVPQTYRDGIDVAFPVLPIVRHGMAKGQTVVADFRAGSTEAAPCLANGNAAWRHLMV